MKSNFGRRLKKIELKIAPEPTGINCYADHIKALESGEEIDYNSTPYLRQCSKSILKFIKEHPRCRDAEKF